MTTWSQEAHARVVANREKALLEAMGEYLDAIGWKAIVGSADRIQQVSVGGTNGGTKYELVLSFTGCKRKPVKT
jgi:hypothetical protein